MADLTCPTENSNFRFILIDAYSESSGRPGGRVQMADLPPLENSNFRFILIDACPLRAQAHQVAEIKWQINPSWKTAISDSY